ncbi:unnamed protein product, partial [marine sediment metagenome]
TQMTSPKYSPSLTPQQMTPPEHSPSLTPQHK